MTIIIFQSVLIVSIYIMMTNYVFSRCSSNFEHVISISNEDVFNWVQFFSCKQTDKNFNLFCSTIPFKHNNALSTGSKLFSPGGF